MSNLVWDEEWALDWHTTPGTGVRYGFRMLFGGELDRARSKRQDEALKRFAELAAIPGMAERTTQAAQDSKGGDVFDQYDPDLLLAGLVAWEEKHPQTGEPLPCTPELKARLAPEVREWAARRVLSLTIRSRGEVTGSGV